MPVSDDTIEPERTAGPAAGSRTLPLLPLTSGVVLPGMVVTLALETPDARAAATASEMADSTIVLVPRIQRPDGSTTWSSVGTIAKIEDVGELANGVRAVVVRGITRAVIGTGVASASQATWVEAHPVDDRAPTPEGQELAKQLRATIEAILEHRQGRGAARIAELFAGGDDPGQVADNAGYWPELAFERKVAVLEATDPVDRIRLVLGYAKEALAELELKAKIRDDVNEGMEKRQREFLLRQQLDAIKKELASLDGKDGEGAEPEDVVEAFKARIADRTLPEHVTKALDKELARFERMSEQSPEHGWIRTWIEWVLDVPWGERSVDRLVLAEAKATLDADHTGLDEVKERILEHLAVRKLRAERGTPEATTKRRGDGAILTLVGPPGVGKTSLGESIARSLGRPFVRVALGGVRDEAEIRGHRRTYVGAQPGRLVRAMKEAGAMNPVILLDEVDKLGGDFRGDPASALLEVLDPAQNHTFADHYLEVELDLSDVLFLATANQLETIAGPLLDRMEVVRLDGYTEDEKVAIARDHLLRRQLDANALRPDEVVVDEPALRAVVTGHTREAGVRSLERQLGRVLRKAATKVAADPAVVPLHIGADDLQGYLGRPKFRDEVRARTSIPGVATGLAVTGVGGDVLFVEATAMPGEGGLTVTGQLGDVMKESAQIALSFVRANAERLGIDADAFTGRRFHVHFPAGAIPKDGPSAGVTMTTALVSLLTGKKVNPTLAMTGEVTLSGQVLPIGGVKQKLLAAHRMGITDVAIPAANEPDLDDVPEAVRDALTVHPVDDVLDLLAFALAS